VKNGTLVPLIGTGTVIEAENCPVVPVRNATTPPVAVDLAVITMLTVGVVAPVGFVTRTRHGDGDHVTNPARALTLLLICNSTFIVILSYGQFLGLFLIDYPASCFSPV